MLIMDLLFKMLALLAVAGGTSAADYRCELKNSHLDCRGAGLSEPPAGYWPDVTWLRIGKNPIKEFPKRSLTGFPNVLTFEATEIELAELDFEEMASMTKATQVYLEYSNIETIKLLPEGVKWESLELLVLTGNRISRLDPDVFTLAPNLGHLHMGENPIVVESGQPLINHPKVEMLVAGEGGCLGDANGALISGLPNLKYLILPLANITSINGAFVNNIQLELIDLSGNSITEITPGTFPLERRLTSLSLSNNPLSRLEPPDVVPALKTGAFLSITDTPLACSCEFEWLFQEIHDKGNGLYSGCVDRQKPCYFM